MNELSGKNFQEAMIRDLKAALKEKRRVCDINVKAIQDYEETIAEQSKVISSLIKTINNYQEQISKADEIFRDLNSEHMRLDEELIGILSSSSWIKRKLIEVMLNLGRRGIDFAKWLYRILRKIEDDLFWIFSPKKIIDLFKNFYVNFMQNYFPISLGKLNQYPPRNIDWNEFQSIPLPKLPPKISIVTPSFNQGGYISQTVESVLSQDYPNLEYIVQDGASTDQTLQVLDRYTSRISKLVSVSDRGQTHAINMGMEQTSGEIMAWLNSDDILLPGALSKVVKFFDANPQVDVVYGGRVIIDHEGREIGRWLPPKHDAEVLKWADFVPQETLFWRRSIWEAVGGLDEKFKFAMDWDLLLRFADQGAHFACIQEWIGGFRVHPLQKTSSEINTTGLQEMSMLRVRNLGKVPDTLEITNAVRGYLRKHQLVDFKWRLLNKKLSHYQAS